VSALLFFEHEFNGLNGLGTMKKKVVTWHPSSVMPQDGEYILVNVVSDVCFLTVLQNGNYVPSEGYRPHFASTKQWAYIDVLLPESDEKKVNKDPCSGCYYALNHKCAIDIKGYCPREEQNK